MKFRPLHDRVLLRRDAAPDTTASGRIILPDAAKEKPVQGEVIAVGSGRYDDAGRLVPLDVKAGDRVIFPTYLGTDLKIDGQAYLVLKESDLIGIILP